ncbi:unnamed protein product [Paramecium pentaurelia]|uniref:Uncharacterized protein n=1 Tax=Paramecium pentaurelia TaxID=43138 RepID=A0A8S1XK60_9CILI|nr:unnamed protein product [Paramecium pentaurelia]
MMLPNCSYITDVSTDFQPSEFLQESLRQLIDGVHIYTNIMTDSIQPHERQKIYEFMINCQQLAADLGVKSIHFHCWNHSTDIFLNQNQQQQSYLQSSNFSEIIQRVLQKKLKLALKELKLFVLIINLSNIVLQFRNDIRFKKQVCIQQQKLKNQFYLQH